MTSTTRTPMSQRFADVTSVSVFLRYGTVYCVRVSLTEDSSFDLHGAQMLPWLNEWLQQCETSSSPEELPF